MIFAKKKRNHSRVVLGLLSSTFIARDWIKVEVQHDVERRGGRKISGNVLAG